MNLVANISVTDDKYPLAFEQFDFNFLAIENIIDKNLDEILGMSEVKQLSEVKPLIRSLNDKIQDLKGFDIDSLEEGSASQEGSDLTWNDYTRLRAHAQSVYASAEKNYNDGIREKLLGVVNPHSWWTTFKSAHLGVDQSGSPLLKPDGTLAYCPREKAALFTDVFDGKQCGDDLSMPLTCFPGPKLTKIAFKSREIKNLLAEMDVYGGAGPDGIFPMLFVRNV